MPTSTVHKTASRIEALIGEKQAGYTHQLPSLRNMASHLGASRASVSRALSLLFGDGTIEPGSRSGTYKVRGVILPVQQRPPSCSRRSELLDGLLKELSLGSWSLGARILISDICKRYRCGPATASQVLLEAVNKGALMRQGRAFICGQMLTQNRHNGSPVYIVGPSTSRSVIAGSLSPFVRRLEGLIARQGWPSPCLVFSDSPASSSVPPEHKVSAIIHIPSGKNAKWQHFLAKRNYSQVLIVDPSWGTPRNYIAEHAFHRITFDNKLAGACAAQYLHGLGHRSIAFFTPYPAGTSWVSERLEGVKNLFPSCSSPQTSGVHLFCGSDLDLEERLHYERKSLGRLGSLAHHTGLLTSDTIKKYLEGAFELLSNWHMARVLKDSFEHALPHRSITAWVGANDEVAAAALAFLVSRQRPVPKDISIMGFDNSPIALNAGLSTVDMGNETMADVTMQFLLRPDLVSFDESNTVVSVPTVIGRATTGPVAGQGRS